MTKRLFRQFESIGQRPNWSGPFWDIGLIASDLLFIGVGVLEEAIDNELQNAQQARALGVDECVAAVLALNTKEVAEFQQKLMAAVWKNK